MYDLTRSGQVEEAMRLQFRMLELFDMMLYSADFPEGCRAAVELRGFQIGRGRTPQTDTQQFDREGLKKVRLKNVKTKEEMKIGFAAGVLEMHCAYALRTDGMFSDNTIRELLMKHL